MVRSALEIIRVHVLKNLVPCSSDRKLQKSLESNSDILIYDLEDSVSPNTADKSNARSRLHDFITAVSGRAYPYVRV
jgi:citrate lyase subunit beta-like protein